MSVIWQGEITNCQLCNNPLDGFMVDGRLRVNGKNQGWANVCDNCHKSHGIGLGNGKGQRYKWDAIDKNWVKIEG